MSNNFTFDEKKLLKKFRNNFHLLNYKITLVHLMNNFKEIILSIGRIK